MPLYESEATHFLRGLLEKRPEIVQKQREHRATWWERKPAPASNDELEAVKARRGSYEYYPFAGK